VQHLRVFGCKAYAKIMTPHGKFEPQAFERVFVGYAQNCKAYIIFDPKTNKTHNCIHVKFDEYGDSGSQNHKTITSTENTD
jgi:hypothetical protein